MRCAVILKFGVTPGKLDHSFVDVGARGSLVALGGQLVVSRGIARQRKVRNGNALAIPSGRAVKRGRAGNGKAVALHFVIKHCIARYKLGIGRSVVRLSLGCKPRDGNGPLVDGELHLGARAASANARLVSAGTHGLGGVDPLTIGRRAVLVGHGRDGKIRGLPGLLLGERSHRHAGGLAVVGLAGSGKRQRNLAVGKPAGPLGGAASGGQRGTVCRVGPATVLVRKAVGHRRGERGIALARIFALGIAAELNKVPGVFSVLPRLDEVVDDVGAIVVGNQARLPLGHLENIRNGRGFKFLHGPGVAECVGLAVAMRAQRAERFAGIGTACPVVIVIGNLALAHALRAVLAHERERALFLRECALVVDLGTAAVHHDGAADPRTRFTDGLQRRVLAIAGDGGQVALHSVVLKGLGLVVGGRPRENLTDPHVVVVAHLGQLGALGQLGGLVAVGRDLDLGGIAGAAEGEGAQLFLRSGGGSHSVGGAGSVEVRGRGARGVGDLAGTAHRHGKGLDVARYLGGGERVGRSAIAPQRHRGGGCRHRVRRRGKGGEGGSEHDSQSAFLHVPDSFQINMRRPCNQPECIQTVAGILDPPKRASKLKQNLNGLSANYRGRAAISGHLNFDSMSVRPESPAHAYMPARDRATATRWLNGRSTHSPCLTLPIKKSRPLGRLKSCDMPARGAFATPPSRSWRGCAVDRRRIRAGSRPRARAAAAARWP